MKYFAAVLVLFVSLFAYYFWYHQDADLTLLFHEKFGRQPCSVLGGKVVWITGASSGIGEYLAYDLAQCGCKLVLSARRKDELERVRDACEDIALQHHQSYDKNKDIMVLPLDLRQYSSHQDLTKQVLDHFGQIDVLVNNGGRTQRGWMKNTPLEVEQELLELNLVGAMSMTKAVLPHMLERNEGQIVVVSSVIGKYGFPYVATYAASKFGLHGYFNSLRMELGDTDINIQIICPGPVKSNIVAYAFTEEKGKQLQGVWIKDEALFQMFDLASETYFKDTSQFIDSAVRMPTERCTKLMVVGMANSMNEIWISTQPALSHTYMSQYMPRVFDWYSKTRLVKLMKNMFMKS